VSRCARIARGRLELAEICAIVRPLARALAAAHDKGIVHRDVKPENVFLVAVPDEPAKVKLLDFGVAKLTKLHHEDSRVHRTATHEIVGTPSYIAPEQARGRAVDHRVDIYALGCVVFELLTGRTPFVADNPADMIAQLLTEPAPRPSAVGSAFGSDVPVELDEIIVAMLAKDANDRPTLAELRRVLDRVSELKAELKAESRATSEPRSPGDSSRVTTPQASLGEDALERADRPGRRSPVVALALGVAAAVAAGWLVFSRDVRDGRARDQLGTPAAARVIAPSVASDAAAVTQASNVASDAAAVAPAASVDTPVAAPLVDERPTVRALSGSDRPSPPKRPAPARHAPQSKSSRPSSSDDATGSRPNAAVPPTAPASSPPPASAPPPAAPTRDDDHQLLAPGAATSPKQ
jgi:eukaryotic-like serine/threonine-protein kinase